MQSDEIASVTLHKERPLLLHLYVFPFLFLYPLLAYAYYGDYDRYIKSEEWTFVFIVSLVSAHALSFLVTRWDVRARAMITSTSVRCPFNPDLVAGKGGPRADCAACAQGRGRHGAAEAHPACR